MKLYFTKTLIHNSEYFPKKQMKELIYDIKFIDKYLKKHNVTEKTKVIVWLNSDLENFQIEHDILNQSGNRISINNDKYPEKLQIFINIKYSLIKSIDYYLKLFDQQPRN